MYNTIQPSQDFQKIHYSGRYKNRPLLASCHQDSGINTEKDLKVLVSGNIQLKENHRMKVAHVSGIEYSPASHPEPAGWSGTGPVPIMRKLVTQLIVCFLCA